MLRSLSLALALVSTCAQAQTGLQHRPAAPDYVLGPGDQIVLHVTDLDEVTSQPIRIDPGGFVDLPLAGRVHAAGLTLEQFKAELSSKLSRFITSPDISVNLTESESRPVSVIGEVANPGVHQLSGSKRLLDVLSLSGGIKPDAGPDVIVTREAKWGKIDAPGTTVDPATGVSTATFPLDPLMSSKNPSSNIVMEPDDVVSIPKGELVYVVGDVRRSGGFSMSTHTEVSVMQAVSLAEGLAPDSAASHSAILRPSAEGDGAPRQIPVDIPKIFKGKAPDVKLYANDVLYIPHSNVKVITRRMAEAAIGISSGIAIYR
jgi:polysaccharide biosynthesis/export protein